MKIQYDSKCLVRCPETGDSEILETISFYPEVSLTVDLFEGTPHQLRVTLKWNVLTRDYREDVRGKILISRGPKILSDRKIARA